MFSGTEAAPPPPSGIGVLLPACLQLPTKCFYITLAPFGRTCISTAVLRNKSVRFVNRCALTDEIVARRTTLRIKLGYGLTDSSNEPICTHALQAKKNHAGPMTTTRLMRS